MIHGHYGKWEAARRLRMQMLLSMSVTAPPASTVVAAPRAIKDQKEYMEVDVL